MKIAPDSVKEIQNFLLDLLPRAGQVTRRYFHAEDLASRKKGEHDFVTEADLAVDRFLNEELEKAYPEVPILTEEKAEGDIEKYKNEPVLWIVDPLDGTANFSRGDVNFSISVALVEKGSPRLGVVFAPISSRLFWTSSFDKSAYWNGRRIGVSRVDDMKKAVVCTDWSHILDTRDATTNFLKKVYGQVRQIKILGSAATDITLLARGGVDIYHHVRLFPWDTAAAGLIAQKAGAVVTDIDGKPWNAFSKGILAANPKLHQNILGLIC